MNSLLLNPRAHVLWGNRCVARELPFRQRLQTQPPYSRGKRGVDPVNSAHSETEPVFAGWKLTLSARNPSHARSVHAAATITSTEGAVREFLVREAEEKDLQQAGQVVYEAFNTFCESIGQGIPFKEDDMEAILFVLGDLYSHPKKRLQVAVAREDGREGKLIGLAGLSLQDTVASVVVVAVDTSSSRKGVGRGLMDSLVGIAEDTNKNGIMSLFVDSANPGGFALYASEGFNTVDVCTFFQGYVSESFADEAVRVVAKEGTYFRLMEESDVPKCNDLYMKAVGRSRLNNIGEMQGRSDPQPSIVAVRLTDAGEEEVVAYCTSYTMFGHSVAIDEQHFKALVSYASKLAKAEGRPELIVQCRPLVNPNVVQWGLKSGMLVKRHNLWMVRGGSVSVNPGLVYGVGTDY